MSELKLDPLKERLGLWYTEDELLGRFHYDCECDIHGGGLFFTDKSGADWCIDCIKTKLIGIDNEQL